MGDGGASAGFRRAPRGFRLNPMTDQRKSQAEAREARLKQALRDNLKRRKAQLRARAAGAPEPESDEAGAQPPKTAGFVPDKPTG
jgi:hypothetical protein